MQINLNYVPSESIGYGRLGVKLHEALAARDIEVFTHLPEPDGPAEVEGRTAGIAEAVCWVSIPSHANGWYGGQRPSILTMWEATRLPESFRENLHHFETVLVPSDQNVELFSRHHPNVKRVLLGVDPTEWHYVERKPPELFFDFLIGGSGLRKGVDLAYEAFVAAFPNADGDGPIPRLIMKSPRGEGYRHDRVTVVAGKLSAEDERALYSDAHCYLQPSRGEGFGLQPLQAIAQGLPTILTDAHGHESFAHLGLGIGADLTPTPPKSFMYGEAGEWWEPRLDELVDQMRWVYDNWGLAVENAKVGAGVVAQDFTWANTADQLVDAIGDHLSESFTPGEWFEPTPVKYRIRVKRGLTADIANRRLTFLPGRDYYDLADVKRVLAEAGHLDPECIADGDGLTDEQVQRLGVTRDYCPHCEQRYGSGLTRADDIMLEREAEVAP